MLEMERRGWVVGGGAWVCRWRLLAWEEEMVSDCPSLLHNVVLQDNIYDRWQCILDPIQGYSVKGTYNYLVTAAAPYDRGLFDDVWQKQVPLKVFVVAWRLIRNQLPTKDNLIRRRIIYHDNASCIGVAPHLSVAWHLIYGSSVCHNPSSSVLSFSGVTAINTFFFDSNMAS